MNEIQRRKRESHYLVWISKIISEDVKNVNITYPTVVDVKLNKDNSVLKVFVVFEKNESKSLEALNATKGFIRSELAKYTTSYKTPELIFIIDSVSKSTAKIDEILKQIKKDNEN